MIVTCSASFSKPPVKILRQRRTLGFFIEALPSNDQVMNPGNDGERRGEINEPLEQRRRNKLNPSSRADRRQDCRKLRHGGSLAPEGGRERAIAGNEAD